MGAPLHLVACVKAKALQPMPAAELYQSAWFKKARAYVEAKNAPWFVLSALHGLVDPSEVIAPYDRTLHGMSSHERDAWGQRVIAQLKERQITARTEIVILAGQNYRKPLAEWLGERAIVPMRGLGIGEQLSWLKRNTYLGETEMRGPKQAGAYPDRDIDCQEAVSQEVADLIEQASLSGTSEADAASAIADTGVPGIQSILHEAAKAGWSDEEIENAIKQVAAGMYRGITGTDE